MPKVVLERKKQATHTEQPQRPKFNYALTHTTPRSTALSGIPLQRQQLCKKCAKIDLDAIFRMKTPTSVGRPVRKLGPVTTWSTESCPLCYLLLRALPQRGYDQSISLELRYYSSKKILERGWQAIDTVMLAIGQPIRSSFLVPQTDGVQIVRMLGPLVDFKIVKDWLDFCDEKHTNTCGAGTQLSPSLSSQSPQSLIPSFKLIDCETRRIIPASGPQQYITLSYVWGKGSANTTYSDTLPEQAPETIEDAILATRRLGFRYLWIDRYCINQENKDEVAEHVSKMDLIYSNSYLTIIAVAGQDPHFGLPGISNRTRRSQPYAMVGRHLLISTFDDPVHSIKSSKWVQRGWTYQEGLLSHRRLIFTEQQMYFECSGMYCCEELNFPLQTLHTANGQRFKSCYCNDINLGVFPKKIGSTAWEVVKRIEEYSSKSLTDPSDILKGILGILRAFEMSSKRIRHYLGVPMLPPPPKPRVAGGEGKSEVNAIYESNKRSTLIGFCGGLCWGVRKPSGRRTGFPSWSWTGWTGEIQWGFRSEDQWRSFQGDTNLQVRIQLRDGNTIDWNTFEQSYNELSSQLSNVFQISAWASTVHVLRPFVSGRITYYQARIDLEDKGPCNWKFRPTGNTPISGTSLIGIQLGYIIPELGSGSIYLMLIREVERGIYERVGLGDISGNNVEVEAESNCDFERALFTFHLPLPKLKRSWQEFLLR